ncbi:retropepsin-like aspartic protease family protein [Empedobacter falsenii]|nr:retropepsin-like aspartic protease [Empedobacter falsenii]
MRKESGVYYIPCKINNLPMEFIFDTGASNVSISLSAAIYMFENGYLNKNDIGEKIYFSIANGDIAEGTNINIRELSIAGIKLFNVEASIVHELKAPLLLGNSVISRLGNISLNGHLLTIHNP